MRGESKLPSTVFIKKRGQMFICRNCLKNKCEGPPISYALMMVESGFGSYGPCEVCRITGRCADIPSSANFTIKRNEIK